MKESSPASSDKGFSGSSLKIIAMAAMLLDHVAAVFLGSYPTPYYIFRLIGRIAFPVFAFLLAEGFFHTKSLPKYCLRLAVFALISEIPFDLAFSHTMFDWESQNVFFTLLIGLLTICGMEYFKNTLAGRPTAFLFCRAAVIAAGMYAAWYLKTDYSAIGVLAITLLYGQHNKRAEAIIDACVFLCFLSGMEIAAFASVPLILCYNGKRGISLKYFFYLFYPVHLMLLFLLRNLFSVI